ncbi:unnamed protein product, partial [Vicia faba]
QDPLSMKMIGSTNKFEGLYHLVLKGKHAALSRINHTSSCTIPDNALWHFRSRHLSTSRMQVLHFTFPFIVVGQKVVYDVCRYAKHKKLPFNSSFNKAARPF